MMPFEADVFGSRMMMAYGSKDNATGIIFVENFGSSE